MIQTSNEPFMPTAEVIMEENEDISLPSNVNQAEVESDMKLFYRGTGFILLPAR